VPVSPDFVLLQRFYFATTALRLAQVWTSVDVGRSIAIDDSDGVFYLVVAAGSGAQCFTPIVGFSTGTFADLASLRLVQGDAGLQTATVTDGTGGAFTWTTDTITPHDGGVVIAATSGRTGAWKRIYDGPVYARWWGAAAGVDCTAAIQAAINFAGSAAHNFGGIVELPSGVLRQSDTLLISQALLMRSITLRGTTNGPQHGQQSGTVLRWVANQPTKPMIRLWGSESSVRDMTLLCGDGGGDGEVNCRCAIDCTKAFGSFGYGANRFSNLYISSEHSVHLGMSYGIIIGDKSQGDVTWPDNGENISFEDVLFNYCKLAGVFVINESGQAKNHVYDRCVFLFCNYGIWTRSSSFKCRDCGFAGLVSAIFEKNPCDVIGIYDTDSEICTRFYSHESGGSVASRPMYFVGGRYDLLGLHADGVYFDFFQPGPVTMVGCYFSNNPTPNFTIQGNSATGNLWQITTIGVNFPTVTNPYAIVVTQSGGKHNWSRVGCSQLVGGAYQAIPDKPAALGLILPTYAQGAEPAGPVEGMVVWNLTTHKKRSYNGTTWVDDP
jgi:hypothetical protein